MNFELSKQAAKTIQKLDSINRKRLRKGIDGIPAGDIKPLKGTTDTFRLRVGDWRILFSYIDDNSLLIEKISPRGDVYKGV